MVAMVMRCFMWRQQVKHNFFLLIKYLMHLFFLLFQTRKTSSEFNSNPIVQLRPVPEIPSVGYSPKFSCHMAIRTASVRTIRATKCGTQYRHFAAQSPEPWRRMPFWRESVSEATRPVHCRPRWLGCWKKVPDIVDGFYSPGQRAVSWISTQRNGAFGPTFWTTWQCLWRFSCCRISWSIRCTFWVQRLRWRRWWEWQVFKKEHLLIVVY